MNRTMMSVIVGLSLALVAAGTVAADPVAGTASAAPGALWRTRPATYQVAVTRDLKIPMSDGVTLVADLRRPADRGGRPIPGRFPVVLTQTPYNKSSGRTAFLADHLVQRGYVQVVVDVRGTGGSGGTWDSLGAREQLDGKELVEWASSRRRPWSDGRVALHGASYGAINQLFTAAQRPRGLKAIFPIVPMSDAYRDVVASGGQIDVSFMPFWLGLVTVLGLVPPTYTATDPAMAAETMGSHARGAATFQGASIADATTGGELAYDGRFYRLRSPIEVVDRIRVPAFVTGGWFDLFQRGEPLLYQHLAAHVPAKLLMGPWSHVDGSTGAGLPADGVPSLEELELHWFDRYVLGRPDRDLARLANVTYVDLGTGGYRTAASWPPPGVRYRELFLSGPASPGRPGMLAPRPPASSSPDVMPWQPISGICSRSTSQWSAGLAGTPCDSDQRLNDLTGLAYDLSVPNGIRLAGPVSVGLSVSTNGRDSLLTVRLEDIAPDGAVTQLTAGWNTIALRAVDPRRTLAVGGKVIRPYHPFTSASVLPVRSGEVVQVWVEVFPTAATLAPGHRLRVSVQPADTPHLAPTTTQLRSQLGGVLRIHHDADHPSVVVIPQLP